MKKISIISFCLMLLSSHAEASYNQYNGVLPLTNGGTGSATGNSHALNEIYVANSGSDTTGTGSYLNPYLTIGNAITLATSGTDIHIFKGTYNENLTLKAGVDLTCEEASGAFINGNMTASYSGTVYVHHCDMACSSGNCLTVSGSNAVNLQMDDTHVDGLSGSGDTIRYTNTNASSKMNCDNAAITQAVSSSAKTFSSSSSSAGSVYFEDVSMQILDNPDHVAISLAGALSFGHSGDQVQGQITVDNTAAYNGYGPMKFITTTVPSIVTNSSTLSSISLGVVLTSSVPVISGTGLFAQGLVIYAGTGQGFATTLNGGAGAQPLPASEFQVHPSVNGSAPFTCSTSAAGTISYSTGSNYICFCNGTAWKQASAPSSACTW